MDYDMLKRKVQDVLGQSSQLRSDNKALLQFLGEVQVSKRNGMDVAEGVVGEWMW